MEQESNYKTDFLNKTDELIRHWKRGTTYPNKFYAKKISFYFLMVYLKACMYSEEEFNKSNHNLLYMTPDFTLIAIFPLVLFSKIRV